MDKAPDAFRTISEVADDLDLPQHVLRFWETRFVQIKPMKRGGGRRYYRPDDVDLLRGIRHLLYGEGYTIRGVQRILKDHGGKFVQTVWKAGAPQPEPASDDFEDAEPEMPRTRSGSAKRKPHETERESRILGMLPALFGSIAEPVADAIIRTEPRLTERPPPKSSTEEGTDLNGRGMAVAAARPVPQRSTETASYAQDDVMPRGAAMPREELRKLQSALYELSECRRLVDEALDGEN